MKRRDFIALAGSAAGLSVARPFLARAQPPAMPLLGFMSARSPEDSARELAAFRKRLRPSVDRSSADAACSQTPSPPEGLTPHGSK